MMTCKLTQSRLGAECEWSGHVYHIEGVSP